MIAAMRHFALFGCPRSGTSWLGQIFNSAPDVAYRYQPLFAHEFKDWFGRHGVSAASIADFHQALAGARSPFVLQALQPAKTVAACMVWKEVRYHQLMAPLLEHRGLDALVYLVRAPVAVINSWYLAPKEFRAGQDIHAEYRDAPSKNTSPCEFNGLAKWKESLAMAIELRRRFPDRVHLVGYERLRQSPVAQVHALFERLGLAPTPSVLAFLAASTSRRDGDPYSVFRGGRTAIELPADIVDAIVNDAQAGELGRIAETLLV
jgi:hypothetical protein